MARLADRVVHHLKRRLIPPTTPLEALPALDMTRMVDRGCCPYDGYQRGTGLAHGDLANRVWNDPLFRKALAIARHDPVRTMLRFVAAKSSGGGRSRPSSPSGMPSKVSSAQTRAAG